jgi:hypothetical protein
VHQRLRTITRRVDQHAVERAELRQKPRRVMEQVADHESGTLREIVRASVLRRTSDQFRAAFYSHHIGAAPRDRKAEITQPAEHVGDAQAGRRPQQCHSPPHEYAVDGEIDLGEVGRLEAET